MNPKIETEIEPWEKGNRSQIARDAIIESYRQLTWAHAQKIERLKREIEELKKALGRGE